MTHAEVTAAVKAGPRPRDVYPPLRKKPVVPVLPPVTPSKPAEWPRKWN